MKKYIINSAHGNLEMRITKVTGSGAHNDVEKRKEVGAGSSHVKD